MSSFIRPTTKGISIESKLMFMKYKWSTLMTDNCRQHGPYCAQLRRVLRQKGPRRAIGNRRAAAATDIENSVIIAGVVQTLYAD